MKNRLPRLIATLIITAIVAACGVGGGGVGTTVAPNSSLSGTASIGAPMAGSIITLTDVTGAKQQATADANGAYNFTNIAGLKTPILVSASGYVGSNPTTYSGIVVSVNSGAVTVANVSPLTDAIVYQAVGQSTGTLRSNPSAMSNISTNAVTTSAANVATALANVLNGITPGSAAGYNPNSTSYVADGSISYDKVHDFVSVYVTPVSGSGAMAINIADKSGVGGSTTITTGQTVTPLPAMPAAIANMALSSLENGFINPLRQNSCRSDMMLILGAIRTNDGSVWRSIQKQSGGAVIAAGERQYWRSSL